MSAAPTARGCRQRLRSTAPRPWPGAGLSDTAQVGSTFDRSNTPLAGALGCKEPSRLSARTFSRDPFIQRYASHL